MLNWDQITEKHLIKFQRDFINCDDETERLFLIELIEELSSDYSKTEIEKAVGFACRNTSHPRDTKKLIEIVKKNIGEV